ncbi:MAG: ABC transporter permease [Methylococcaceae bacterium]|nr:ABC transporter permease [Methylococcaceae bacterium]
MIHAVKRHADLLCMMFVRDFKSLYINNMLGLAWVILNPLFVVLLYSFVFSEILKIRGQGYDEHYSYAVFLLAGIIPFLALSEVLPVAASCLQQKKDLLIKSLFPAALLPVNTVLLSLVSEFVMLIMVLCLAFYEQGQVQLMWLCLPLLVLLRLMFSLALAWWISILSVFIPDLRLILNAILPAWMFLTPILYVPAQAPDFFQRVQQFNPLFYIVDAYRAVILQATWPATPMLLSFGVLLIFNVGGYYLFKVLMPRAKDFL